MKRILDIFFMGTVMWQKTYIYFKILVIYLVIVLVNMMSFISFFDILIRLKIILYLPLYTSPSNIYLLRKKS